MLQLQQQGLEKHVLQHISHELLLPHDPPIAGDGQKTSEIKESPRITDRIQVNDLGFIEISS